MAVPRSQWPPRESFTSHTGADNAYVPMKNTITACTIALIVHWHSTQSVGEQSHFGHNNSQSSRSGREST